jgi:hypothetical protein
LELLRRGELRSTMGDGGAAMTNEREANAKVVSMPAEAG